MGRVEAFVCSADFARCGPAAVALYDKRGIIKAGW
jgi:hypothetical protein